MLYALSRENGSVAITTVLPKAITVDGKTMPVVGVDGSGPQLFAKTEDDKLVAFPLPSADMRLLKADSVPGAVLTFYSIEEETAKIQNGNEYLAKTVIPANALPTSREYRNGWTLSGKTITHSMPLCRVIHRDKLREARKPMLEVLDVAYQRADEQDDGPLKREIAKKKQALRDITANPLIEQATTIEKLKALTVEYLLAHP